jgi:uncharacterized protein
MLNKVVIVTGASSGIGAATARRLAKDGARLALVARRVEQLQEVAAEVKALGGQALTLQTDVRDRQALQGPVRATVREWGRIDVLLNCAGLGRGAHVAQLDPDQVREQIEVNLIAVMECTQAVLPTMIAQRAGHIINVASIAGLIGLPASSVYSATKFGVVGFSEALRREVRRYGIHVTILCPGFVATGFSPELQRAAEGRADGTRLPGLMQAGYVANHIAGLIRHPRRSSIIPPGWGMLVALARACPWLTDVVLGWVDRKGLATR